METTRKTRAERVRQASRARRELARSELRAAILEAAAALFVDAGYERFSMREVAERIGYSATTIYRYFRDKDELIFAVVDAGFRDFGARLVAASASTEDPALRIRAIGRAYVQFGREQTAYYRVMFVDRADYMRAPVDGSEAPRLDSFLVLQNAVKAAIEHGSLRQGDARAYSNALWALVHGIVMLGVTFPDLHQFEDSKAVDAALDVAFGGLLPT